MTKQVTLLLPEMPDFISYYTICSKPLHHPRQIPFKAGRGITIKSKEHGTG